MATGFNAKMRIPQHILNLKSYKPGKPVSQICEELGIQSPAILWNNENNAGPSPGVKNAITKVADVLHRYPDPLSDVLVESISALCHRQPSEIVVGNGSEAILNNLFTTFFEPGDTLLTSEGTFVAVYIWAKAHNVSVQSVPLTSEYAYDLEGIIKSINSSTRLIYIASPNNPTGTGVSAAQLDDFLKRVPEHILVLVDEAYFEYAVAIDNSFPDSTTLQMPNVITLRTFSKAYGIAGVRIGYVVAAEAIAEALRKVKLTFEPGICAQAAALAAIRDRQYLQKCVVLNRDTLQAYYSCFASNGIGYIPSYGNFVMLDMRDEENATALTEFLLRKGVFVRHLKAFGLPECVRVSTGLPQETQSFIASVSDFIQP